MLKKCFVCGNTAPPQHLVIRNVQCGIESRGHTQEQGPSRENGDVGTAWLRPGEVADFQA